MDCNNKSLFPGQKPEEKISLFVRRHWISFLPTAFLSFFMAALPLVVFLIVICSSKMNISTNIIHYSILAASAYILFIMTFFIINWVDYYFDILIVTDERLVNIEQNGLFSRHVSELDLIRVQNVSTTIKGIVPTFFDFGTVVVQTAGENSTTPSSISSDFTMSAMPHPNIITQEILQLHQKLISRRGQVQAATFGEGEIYSQKNVQNDDGQNSDFQNVPSKPEKAKQRVTVSPQIDGQLNEGETIDL